MASTPSNRLKLTPSNSPFLPRPSRSPIRARAHYDSRLSLTRVVGTTCATPTGFDTVQSSFAYIAGGAVVVVDVDGSNYSQRFYRARPTAIPIYAVSPVPHAPSTPNATPKANDSRNRVAASSRDSFYGTPDWAESPTPKTWTSRERIKAATCLSLSRDGRFLAVGETGYNPRVLIFSLQDHSSDIPLVSISEHTFGVKAVAWSPDTRYLASLGAANDGFLYLWRIDHRTGAAKLFQQNRCTSFVHGMMWLGSSLITFGVRHVKVWRVEEGASTSPVKKLFGGDATPATPTAQKTLPGRNILLGSLLEAAFCCGCPIDDSHGIICTEAGDVCLLDDTSGQMKLTRVVNLGFPISCVSLRDRVAHIGGKTGQYASVDIDAVLECQQEVVLKSKSASTGLVAMGYMRDNLVTIDAKRSIAIWSADYIFGEPNPVSQHIQIPGHGDPILGIQLLPSNLDGSFYTWSGAGKIQLWDLEGNVKSSLDVPIEMDYLGSDADTINQLCVVKISKDGKYFVAGDKMGVLRIMDFASKTCLMETKAHSTECQVITIHEDDSKFIIASCGRDRTTQLFQRISSGSFELFQTLEFAAKVVQVLFSPDDKIITCSFDRTLQLHDLLSKEGEPDTIAAISSRIISLKASPTSMVLSPDNKSVFVSSLDRSICQYELATGRHLSLFKCTDEGGMEAAVLDSLIYGQNGQNQITESGFLLGISNTDKSVRLYDSQTGSFLDREWGHTEAINGVVLIEDEDTGRKVVSVGSDGTIMVWALDLQDPTAGSRSRDPSPAKDAFSTASRPPLRRVLSKAELAEFQRPSPSPGRRSPPRTLQRRTSRFNLSAATRTPTAAAQGSPASTVHEETPSRRASSGSRPGSPPPVSPKARVTRRPSLPALSTTPPTATATRKKSAINLRSSYGFGSLNMATEQTCRQLRAYRKKLASSDPITSDTLAELDTELRLTVAALTDRAARTKQAVSETMLSGLLDQYSERLVSMLDEKLRLRLDSQGGKDADDSVSASVDDEQDRPHSPGEGSCSGST